MTDPLLTIMTRRWPAGRATSYEIMRRSVETQTRVDGWEHVFLFDDSQEGRGVAWADANLVDVFPQTRGAYIWVVDDDDLLESDAVEVVLETIAANGNPGVVVVKGTFGMFGVLPREDVWMAQPIWGGISGQNVVVRRDLALKHCHAWRDDPTGDVGYSTRIWADYPQIVWLDRMVVHQQRNGFGRPDWG